jgi:hypothetical protein
MKMSLTSNGRRVGTALIAAALTAFAIGGLAIAASGNPADSSSGAFSACLNSKSGALGSVTVSPSSPAVCPKGTVAVSWNAQGPAGAPGAVGPTGPEGPTGAPGATGATGASGADGADGATILNGPGAPAASLGRVGDLYLDTASYAFYGPKTSDGWGSPHVLSAPSTPPSPSASPTTPSIDLMTDVNNCGAVGNVVPQEPNSTPSCSDGHASFNCFGGYADVDLVFSNGCEVNLMTDPDHCGAVGVHVQLPNATTGCVLGHAVIIACYQGYEDLNNVTLDGCEYKIPPSSTPSP